MCSTAVKSLINAKYKFLLVLPRLEIVTCVSKHKRSSYDAGKAASRLIIISNVVLRQCLLLCSRATGEPIEDYYLLGGGAVESGSECLAVSGTAWTRHACDSPLTGTTTGYIQMICKLPVRQKDLLQSHLNVPSISH